MRLSRGHMTAGAMQHCHFPAARTLRLGSSTVWCDLGAVATEPVVVAGVHVLVLVTCSGHADYVGGVGAHAQLRGWPADSNTKTGHETWPGVQAGGSTRCSGRT